MGERQLHQSQYIKLQALATGSSWHLCSQYTGSPCYYCSANVALEDLHFLSNRYFNLIADRTTTSFLGVEILF